MEERYINLILVLVTGRVWSEQDITNINFGNKSINVWDYKYGIEFLVSHFVINDYKETIRVNLEHGFRPWIPLKYHKKDV